MKPFLNKRPSGRKNLRSGSRNTGYFHRITKLKNKTKLISSIKVDDEIVTEPYRISDHIVNYYKNLFFSSNYFLQDNFLVEEAIPMLIDETTNNILTMLPTMEEVKYVVFSLNSDGALGLKYVVFSLKYVVFNLISKEQMEFVRGRNIRDCIALTSEVVNVLDKKIVGGNHVCLTL